MYLKKHEIIAKIKDGTIQEEINYLNSMKSAYENQDPGIVDEAHDSYDSMFDEYLYEYISDGLDDIRWQLETIQNVMNENSDIVKVKNVGFYKIKKLL
jgi:hypothetical protein